MDGLREPVGGQSPEVYWRRRIVAIVGAVLLLVVLYFLVSSPGGDADPADDVTNSPAVTTSPDPTETVDAAASRACTSADVTVTVAPNPFSVAGGALPVFDVTLTQVGSTPCLVDTAATDTEFAVWSGGESNKDIYFSSTYCADDPTVTAREFLLQPGGEESLNVTWSRQRIGEGCVTGADPGAGFYWAQLTVQGIASEPTQFELAG